MSAQFLFQILWMILIVLPDLGKAETVTSCKMNIGSCDYKLTLVPSNKCHQNTFTRSRSKRSEVSEYETAQIMGELAALQSDFEKLERKLVKEMKGLSTRVLRGARRLETMADGAMSNSHGKKKSKCPSGFVTYDDWDSCYLFSTFNTTWYDARDYCVALGSDIVALESLQEHLLVSFYIQNNPDYRTAEGWWTSGTYVSEMDKWMWMSNGGKQIFTYWKWAVNEPNDTLEKDLQCMMMYKLDGLLWHDQICTDKYNFVCEKPAA